MNLTFSHQILIGSFLSASEHLHRIWRNSLEALKSFIHKDEMDGLAEKQFSSFSSPFMSNVYATSMRRDATRVALPN